MSEYDDERVQQVIDALDPTPASDVDWPVSRRQTLRALAAAGLLGAGSGSASAESVGGVIADEATLSNYASESVSDGWELTIDDDVFGLTESEKTIELPDGGVGEEFILPNGAGVSQMIAPDGSVVFEGIPDSEVYLYDDWGDNRLTNREDSATTTHNAVEGVYRPEYTLTDGSATAENEELQLSDGDALHTNINLNLDESITWEFENVDVSDNPSEASESYLTCWSESISFDFDFPRAYEQSYGLLITDEQDVRFVYIDSGGNRDELITDDMGNSADLRVERSPNGEFELFIDGVSQGTATDTNLTDPEFFGFISHERELSIHEYKVS